MRPDDDTAAPGRPGQALMQAMRLRRFMSPAMARAMRRGKDR